MHEIFIFVLIVVLLFIFYKKGLPGLLLFMLFMGSIWAMLFAPVVAMIAIAMITLACLVFYLILK